MANFKCSKCQYENPPTAKFCSECGTSLVFKCPICNSETPLHTKFCSGCGKDISTIRKDIEIAKKAVGENRELSYTTYRSRNQTVVVTETLAIDEYVLLKEGNIFFYKGDVADAVGELYLTNRRILILGSEAAAPRVYTRNYSYPLNDITNVEAKKEKVLFTTNHYLQIIFDGKLRKFSLPERVLNTWISTIIKYKQEK